MSSAVRATSTCTQTLSFQVALFAVARLRWAELASLHAELVRLVAELSSGAFGGASAPAPPQAHGAAAASAAAHAPAHPAGAAQEFLVHQIVPAAAPASLAAVPHAAAPITPVALAQLANSEEVEVRGVCDGCGQTVTSDDEGRKRQGDKYYHARCIKGYCACCHTIVHADAARVVIDGAYWHTDCTRNIAGPSSQRGHR